jgi:hypothetical protein
MTCQPSTIDFILPKERFDEATERVNTWRGQCLATLARAETAVTKCLPYVLARAAVRDRPKQIHLIGQRYAALDAALASNSWSGRHSAKALKAVREMAAYHHLRVLLCHGTATISIDRRGTWISVWYIATLDASSIVNNVEVVTQDDAAKLAGALKRAGDRLCSLLANVQAEIGHASA